MKQLVFNGSLTVDTFINGLDEIYKKDVKQALVDINNLAMTVTPGQFPKHYAEGLTEPHRLNNVYKSTNTHACAFGKGARLVFTYIRIPGEACKVLISEFLGTHKYDKIKAKQLKAKAESIQQQAKAEQELKSEAQEFKRENNVIKFTAEQEKVHQQILTPNTYHLIWGTAGAGKTLLLCKQIIDKINESIAVKIVYLAPSNQLLADVKKTLSENLTAEQLKRVTFKNFKISAEQSVTDEQFAQWYHQWFAANKHRIPADVYTELQKATPELIRQELAIADTYTPKLLADEDKEEKADHETTLEYLQPDFSHSTFSAKARLWVLEVCKAHLLQLRTNKRENKNDNKIKKPTIDMRLHQLDLNGASSNAFAFIDEAQELSLKAWLCIKRKFKNRVIAAGDIKQAKDPTDLKFRHIPNILKASHDQERNENTVNEQFMGTSLRSAPAIAELDHDIEKLMIKVNGGLFQKRPYEEFKHKSKSRKGFRLITHDTFADNCKKVALDAQTYVIIPSTYTDKEKSIARQQMCELFNCNDAELEIYLAQAHDLHGLEIDRVILWQPLANHKINNKKTQENLATAAARELPTGRPSRNEFRQRAKIIETISGLAEINLGCSRAKNEVVIVTSEHSQHRAAVMHELFKKHAQKYPFINTKANTQNNQANDWQTRLKNALYNILDGKTALLPSAMALAIDKNKLDNNQLLKVIEEMTIEDRNHLCQLLQAYPGSRLLKAATNQLHPDEEKTEEVKSEATESSRIEQSAAAKPQTQQRRRNKHRKTDKTAAPQNIKKKHKENVDKIIKFGNRRRNTHWLFRLQAKHVLVFIFTILVLHYVKRELRALMPGNDIYNPFDRTFLSKIDLDQELSHATSAPVRLIDRSCNRAIEEHKQVTKILAKTSFPEQHKADKPQKPIFSELLKTLSPRELNYLCYFNEAFVVYPTTRMVSQGGNVVANYLPTELIREPNRGFMFSPFKERTNIILIEQLVRKTMLLPSIRKFDLRYEIISLIHSDMFNLAKEYQQLLMSAHSRYQQYSKNNKIQFESDIADGRSRTFEVYISKHAVKASHAEFTKRLDNAPDALVTIPTPHFNSLGFKLKTRLIKTRTALDGSIAIQVSFPVPLLDDDFEQLSRLAKMLVRYNNFHYQRSNINDLTLLLGCVGHEIDISSLSAEPSILPLTKERLAQYLILLDKKSGSVLKPMETSPTPKFRA